MQERESENTARAEELALWLSSASIKVQADSTRCNARLHGGMGNGAALKKETEWNGERAEGTGGGKTGI